MAIDAPQNARSRRTRAAIQTAAIELLRSEGVAAVTMEAVADRAGCSRRALYLHFGSRAELFVSLIDFTNETAGHADAIRPVEQASDPVQRLRAFGAFLGDFHARVAPILLAVERVRDSDEAAAEVWRAAMARWYGGCQAMCGELAEHGLLAERFASVDDAADLMWSLMSPGLMQGLLVDRGWSPAKFGEHIGELFVAALTRKA